MGATAVTIHVEESRVNSPEPLLIRVCVDVEGSYGPMLISHESLSKMKCCIDFRESRLAIISGIKILPLGTHSVHLMIPGGRPPQSEIQKVKAGKDTISPMEIRLPTRALTSEEIIRVFLQMGHCSENNLRTAIRADRMHGGIRRAGNYSRVVGAESRYGESTRPK